MTSGPSYSPRPDRINPTDHRPVEDTTTGIATTLADNPEGDSSTPKTSTDRLVFVADVLISGLLIGPLTVLYWRGTWTLLDRHLFPHDQAASGWVCSVVGNVGQVGIVYAQGALAGRLRGDRAVDWVVGYHLFTYVLGLFNVCHWRGLWVLLDCYSGVNAFSAWTSFIVGKYIIHRE
jgi:hypothetical protein